MLNLSNLSIKERVYLTELFRTSKISDSRLEITEHTLKFLRRGVLQASLQVLSPNLHPKKIRILDKLINKISYPEDVVEGEIVRPAGNLLKDKAPE